MGFWVRLNPLSPRVIKVRLFKIYSGGNLLVFFFTYRAQGIVPEMRCRYILPVVIVVVVVVVVLVVVVVVVVPREVFVQRLIVAFKPVEVV